MQTVLWACVQYLCACLPPLSPGVYLDSVEPHPPSLRAEPSQPEEAGLGFWLVRPGGGLEGAATDSALGGKGTFHSSWAREEFDTEPPPGDHFDSLGLAARTEGDKALHQQYSQLVPTPS